MANPNFRQELSSVGPAGWDGEDMTAQRPPVPNLGGGFKQVHVTLMIHD